MLFPGLPLVWEGWARYRESRSARGRRFLTFFDRLVLRTLAINALFVAALLGMFPERAFVALSARGDWMLDGHHGDAAETARTQLLRGARLVEWLYAAAHENPYRDANEASDDTPTPTPAPSTSSTTSAPSTSASQTAPTSTAAPVDSSPPSRSSPSGVTWPMPQTLHPAIAAMPPEAEASIDSVGAYIASQEPNPVARVKAIHDWVVDRVAYDAPVLKLPRVPDEAALAEPVFRSRKGVCAGYANLMAAIGRVTGDRIVYLVGDARSQDSPMAASGHAWNAVELGGSWYLIDATWDAGYVNGDTFTKRYSTDYLFTPADVFAIQHFPDEAKWQLLERPIDRAEYFRRPVLSPTFYRHGLSLERPDRSQVSSGRTLDVLIANPHRRHLLIGFTSPNGGRVEHCGTATDRASSAATCTFPASGTYGVNFFVSETQIGTYEFAGAVQVNARP